MEMTPNPPPVATIQSEDAVPRRELLAAALSPMAFGLLAMGAGFLWLLGKRWTFILEDAYITLRYSRNLYEGFGPVYNPGEEPVEGYTNFLWMIFMSVHFFFTSHPEKLFLFYGRLFGFLVLASTWWEFVRRGEFGRRWMWLGVGLVALNQSTQGWMAGGMETHFFSFLVFFAVARFLREEFQPLHARRPYSALIMSLALLERPEGYLAGLTCGAILFWRRIVFAKGAPGGFLRVLVWGGICALIGGGHLLWRHHYYHEWVPNTFYAKVPGAYFKVGIPYITLYFKYSYLHWSLVAACIAVAIPAVIFQRRSPLAGQLFVLAAITGTYSYYIMYVGGDVFEFRLMTPTIPLLALMVPMAFETVGQWVGYWTPRWSWARPATEAGLAALGGGGFLAMHFFGCITNQYKHELYEIGHTSSLQMFENYTWQPQFRAAGEWFRRFADPKEMLATPSAGMVPYISRLPTLDVYGLNDKEIAHKKIDTRGMVGHEKRASWEEIVQRGAVYYFEQAEYMKSPDLFADWQRKQNDTVIVRLLTGEWMLIRVANGADTIRAKLRERGAMVAPGPNEKPEEVAAINERNRPKFEELMIPFKPTEPPTS